jgi:hypothetical protein
MDNFPRNLFLGLENAITRDKFGAQGVTFTCMCPKCLVLLKK